MRNYTYFCKFYSKEDKLLINWRSKDYNPNNKMKKTSESDLTLVEKTSKKR